jgi:CBS-domain-containing membrane protein
VFGAPRRIIGDIPYSVPAMECGVSFGRYDSGNRALRAHGVRRLPVMAHEGEVVGIITLDDLLRLFVADASARLGIMMKGQINEQHSRS